MHQIPILINKKGSKANERAFTIFPIQDNKLQFHRRQKTYDSAEKLFLEKGKHDTLESNIETGQKRYRRASSSGASNKFPKDFFKQNLPTTPIRIRINRSRKQNILNSQKLIHISENADSLPHTEKKSDRIFKITIPQSTEQSTPSILQTPKFNHKSNKQQQCDQNVRQVNNTRIYEYLTTKKDKVSQVFSNRKPLTNYSSNYNNVAVLKSNPNNLNQNNSDDSQAIDVFFQTLGKKPILLEQMANSLKKDCICKKQNQKQNLSQRFEIYKQNKSMRNFLSTKGCYKLGQKLSFKKIKVKDCQQKITSRYESYLKKELNEMEKNQFFKHEKYEFRIRKYA